MPLDTFTSIFRRLIDPHSASELHASDPAQKYSKFQYATFTDLPPELRNQIYDLILSDEQHRWQQISGTTISAKRLPEAVPLPISRTCRVARQETLHDFLSGLGALHLILLTPADVQACREWLLLVPASSLAQVREMKIEAPRHVASGRPCCKAVYNVQPLSVSTPVRMYWVMAVGCLAWHEREIRRMAYVQMAILGPGMEREVTREKLGKMVGVVKAKWWERKLILGRRLI